MSIRGTLLIIGALLWLSAIGCWLRGRGSWRLPREGVLFLLLGVPFLVAGWFYTASSYPSEVVPAPPKPPMATEVVAVAPSPAPASTPPPEQPVRNTYAEAVIAAQRAAVARYPELGRAGTEFNQHFLAAYRRLQRDDPNFFSDPEWPLHLADRIARGQGAPE